MKITWKDFMMGRDDSHPADLTNEVMQNASVTIDRVNLLLERMATHGVPLEGKAGGSLVNSGWRPAAVNAATPGAAAKSKHMTGEACDLYDPEGALDDWCIEHQDVLADIGLWLEHPSATKGWCHVQTVPPRSGRQVFYP